MRIVAGLAKGRRLARPAAATRPTSDRVREALFNTLGALTDLAGARVLDLFAGTGAVGLEALSRGAAQAVLVERDRAAAAVLRRNVATVGLPGAVVEQRAVAAYLAGAPSAFGFVFADPPYEQPDEDIAGLLNTLVAADWLTAGAIVVVERGAQNGPPAWPAEIVTLPERRYGDGVLWYGRRR